MIMSAQARKRSGFTISLYIHCITAEDLICVNSLVTEQAHDTEYKKDLPTDKKTLYTRNWVYIPVQQLQTRTASFSTKRMGLGSCMGGTNAQECQSYFSAGCAYEYYYEFRVKRSKWPTRNAQIFPWIDKPKRLLVVTSYACVMGRLAIISSNILEDVHDPTRTYRCGRLITIDQFRY